MYNRSYNNIIVWRRKNEYFIIIVFKINIRGIKKYEYSEVEIKKVSRIKRQNCR